MTNGSSFRFQCVSQLLDFIRHLIYYLRFFLLYDYFEGDLNSADISTNMMS